MNLVISFDSYSWVNACAGRIIDSPAKFQVLVVYKDFRPLLYAPNLCDEAIYAQRTNDLFTLGKELRIKKMSNLGHYVDDLDIEKLTTQLHLAIMFSGVGTIIYQFSPLLYNILSKIKKNDSVELLAYDTKVDGDELVVFELDNAVWSRKAYLQELMVGVHSMSELPDLKRAEVLVKRK